MWQGHINKYGILTNGKLKRNWKPLLGQRPYESPDSNAKDFTPLDSTLLQHDA